MIEADALISSSKYKIVKPSIVDISAEYLNDPSSKFVRIINYFPDKEPSIADIERLKSWIEREKPTLNDLKNTQLKDITE